MYFFQGTSLWFPKLTKQGVKAGMKCFFAFIASTVVEGKDHHALTRKHLIKLKWVYLIPFRSDLAGEA